MSYLIIIRNPKSKVIYDIRSHISGNPATEKRQFSCFFSLTPLYLALVCAGEGGMMMMMSKNLKVLNKN
jgi:hypothetical protein